MGLYCYEAQPCQMSLSNSHNQGAKMIPAGRINYSPNRVLQEPNTLLVVLWQALLSTALYGSQNNTSAMDRRLSLVDSVMSTYLVSKYSAYWPMYGVNTNYILSRFYCRKLKPLRNNASPSNTDNARISRTTTRTPKISPPIVNIFSFDIFNVFRFELPEGGILCVCLEPARTYFEVYINYEYYSSIVYE